MNSGEITNMISLSTAGGGKTTRLIQRINEILKHNPNKNKILVISFTNSSCDDILQRCGINAMTLHSFCYKFLPSKFTIEEDILKFTNIFLGNFFHLSRLGENAVNRLLNSYFIFQNFPKEDLPLSKDDAILNKEFQELTKEIIKEKMNHNCLFFPDIIHEFLDKINDFLPEISQQFDHILIDEAQDLSELQLQILSKLIENVFLDENKSFFIVGDVKQSIYDFQGSSPEIYLKFVEELKSLCKNKDIELIFEKNNKTYRFGGEILEKVNKHFENHESDKIDGFYQEIAIDDTKEIEDKVIKIVLKHLEDNPPSNIMVLYERSGKMIENLQNVFDGLGLNIKIYTQNNVLIDGLKDIVGFLQTGSNWYTARILQGPFFHLQEPHFYFLSQCIGEDYTKYNREFFEQIKILRNFPDLLIKFLSTRIISCSSIDSKLMNILYEMSFSCNSIDSLMINLPETIKLKEEGIKFSTIHSAKGLEAEIVIYIPQKERKETLTVNLNPFFFFLENNNEFTKFVKGSQIKSVIQGKKNLYYVAMTRAKKYLYEIKMISIFDLI